MKLLKISLQSGFNVNQTLKAISSFPRRQFSQPNLYLIFFVSRIRTVPKINTFIIVRWSILQRQRPGGTGRLDAHWRGGFLRLFVLLLLAKSLVTGFFCHRHSCSAGKMRAGRSVGEPSTLGPGLTSLIRNVILKFPLPVIRSGGRLLRRLTASSLAADRRFAHRTNIFPELGVQVDEVVFGGATDGERWGPSEDFIVYFHGGGLQHVR